MLVLEKIHIRGFKSIRDQDLALDPLNVVIGANGSGKSNLIGVFHFLSRIVSRELGTYTGIAGGANRVLHFGRKRSPSLSLSVQFGEGDVGNGYSFDLAPTDEDRFVFTNETAFFHDRSRHPGPYEERLGAGHAEALLTESTKGVAKHVGADMRSYRIYHFHDTSAGAPVRQTCDVEDNVRLSADGGNLAAFLYRLQEKSPGVFRNVEDTIRQIAPFFEGFHLGPSRLNPDKIRLEWREKGSDDYFNGSALSDGTLRFTCLATLFLQPTLPPLVLLDEPELGLHPAAIGLLAELLLSAATRSQIVVATQSVTLVNQFGPEHIRVVEREDGQSVFGRLDKADMSRWLDDYALGELWEKNVFGGRP